MFFGNFYLLHQSTFEAWTQTTKLGWERWHQDPEWGMPIRQSHADYFMPARAGDVVQLKFYLKDHSPSSVTFFSEVFLKGQKIAEITTVQVFVDRKKMTKISMPPEAREGFGL